MPALNQDTTSLGSRQQFRYYSRRVVEKPTSKYDHEQRISVAETFYEDEPLQGALADFFYACWYNLSDENFSLLYEVKDRLSPEVFEKFQRCLEKKEYVQPISELATRWSVLVSPSIDVPMHRLRIGRDDSMRIAKQISQQLLEAQEQQNEELVEQIEADFITHCLACLDRVAFLTVWIKLSNRGWKFTPRWLECHNVLEKEFRESKVKQ